MQDAFEDAIKARQDKERKINEGKAYANDILPRSQGQAARFLEDAEAYRQSTIAKASGDTDRFLLVGEQYAPRPRRHPPPSVFGNVGGGDGAGAQSDD